MRVGIYCRLSKEDQIKQDESESIKNQKKLLTTYAMQSDWEIVQYYVDEDYKGSDRDRPEFNRLLRDAEARCFDIILCKSQARFCRDLELIEKYLHGKFLEWGIRFISVVDRTDTDDRANKKSRQIIGLKDEWYLEDLSDDIKRVLNQKRRDGSYIATWALYGYKKNPEKKGSLIIDPEPAEVVRDIYRMYLAGYGMQRIARILNDRQIDNPYRYKIRQGLNVNQNVTRKAEYWSVGAVYSILTNQTYTGDLVQGRMRKVSYKSKKLIRTSPDEWYIVPNTHEGIISKEAFFKVQEARRAKGRPVKNGKRHIFSGKVYCMECGQIMSAGRYPKKKKDDSGEKEYVSYLKCSSRITRLESCIGATILMPNLERYLLREINRLSELYFSDNEISKRADLDQKTEERQEIGRLRKQLQALSKKLDNSEIALKKLYMDRVKGVVTEEEFLMLKQSLSEDSKQAQTAYEHAGGLLQGLEEQQQRQADRREIVSRYRKLEVLNREILDELIETIYIGHKDKETKQQVVRIIWAI